MIKFKIRDRVNGVDILQEVNAIDYDDYTYYVSQRLNKNYRFKHALFDKKTGLMLCYGKNKRELFDKYNNLYETYTRIRGYKCYKEYIEQYEQLKKEVNL